MNTPLPPVSRDNSADGPAGRSCPDVAAAAVPILDQPAAAISTAQMRIPVRVARHFAPAGSPTLRPRPHHPPRPLARTREAHRTSRNRRIATPRLGCPQPPGLTLQTNEARTAGTTTRAARHRDYGPNGPLAPRLTGRRVISADLGSGPAHRTSPDEHCSARTDRHIGRARNRSPVLARSQRTATRVFCAAPPSIVRRNRRRLMGLPERVSSMSPATSSMASSRSISEVVSTGRERRASSRAVPKVR